jgi:predicted 3-demethylubiquinone-9 3-methyltransferase (glyoxalase superfamily)
MIKPCLWFDNNLEDAMNFYISVFKDSEVLNVNRLVDGSTITAEFRLRDQVFMALNGGPQFRFSEAISFLIECEDQEEVDYYWETLSEGGETSMCGWTKDKFGLSWQVIPVQLMQLMGGPDSEKANRVFQAMMKMSKIDIAALQAAYNEA